MDKLGHAINRCYELARFATTEESMKEQLQLAEYLEELQEYRNKHKVVYWEHVGTREDANGNVIDEYRCTCCKYAVTIPNNAMPTPPRCFSCDSKISGVLDL